MITYGGAAGAPDPKMPGVSRRAPFASGQVGAGGGTRTPTGFWPNGFSYQLRLAPPPPSRSPARAAFVVWTIPSPWRRRFRCRPSSLYTFPFPGLARDCHSRGSPEFGQFCIPGFPMSTQIASSPLRLPIPPRPRGCPLYRGEWEPAKSSRHDRIQSTDRLYCIKYEINID